jgi:superfamily II DNA/RNA helicase
MTYNRAHHIWSIPMTLTESESRALTFEDLGVPEFICRSLSRRGFDEPFAIQRVAIADILQGHDVCGAAPTGSGKTLAFGIPLVAMTPKGTPRRPKALVLSPTRELADQIASEMETLSSRTSITTVYGGVAYGKQVNALKHGTDILVACPGRLEDLMESGSVILDDIERVVIDEADRMADMGFLPAVRRILDAATSRTQTILFSATLDGDVAHLVKNYQHDPIRHEVVPQHDSISIADHRFWTVSRDERVSLLAETVAAAWPTIVFCRTRHGADRLTKQLERDGIKAVSIHGGKSQPQRTRALAEFTEHRAHALIATDVAARGIHVDDVTSVVHFDPPEDHKAYIHRSGRTARAGQGGVVVSLIEPNGRRAARRMQREVGIEVEIVDPDVASITSFGDSTATLAPAREVNERSRSSSKQRQRSQSKKSGGQSSGQRRDSSRSQGDSSKRDGRKPHRGQSARYGDDRSDSRRSEGADRGSRENNNDSRRSDSNDRPRRSESGRSESGRNDSRRNETGGNRQDGPGRNRNTANAGKRRNSSGGHRKGQQAGTRNSSRRD